MVNIKQDFIPAGKGNRPGYAMDPEYITIHNTANTSKGADAEAHSRLCKNGGGAYGVSWHFTVDSTGVIYQHLPLNENGWHAGDGGSGTGNRKSIGIEICENSDGNFEKALGYAVELVAKLMKDHGIPLAKVVPHKHWSGKQCPRKLLARWDEIVGKIATAAAQPKPQPAGNPQPITPGATHKIQSGDTFFSIAQSRGITVATLQAANPSINPLQMQIGQTINLSAENPATYTIRSGDTLWGIAEQTKGLTVGDLIKANPGINPQALTIGHVINIQRGTSAAPSAPKKPTVVEKVVQAVKKPSHPLPSGVLRKGSRGNDVKQLQEALNAVYFKCGAPDGVYGAKTEDAVKRFQSMYGTLKADGVYGPATRAKLAEKLK